MQIPPYRRYAAALVALVTIAILAFVARQPSISGAEQAALAGRFRFTAVALLDSLHVPVRHERQVNPAFQHFAGWISSVGAAVALNDLDGDGLPNDVCLVDPRLDQIIVAPVPGSGARYERLILEAQPLPFDRATMAPMGCLPGDLNEDGEMDLVAYYWGRTPIAFMRAGSGYKPTEIAATQERWFTNAATLADLDGDGHADLVIANYFADGSRIIDAQAAVADEMPHSMSRAHNGGHLHFFMWAGASQGEVPDVVYKEFAAQIDAPHQTGWTLAVGAADLDNDALADLYLANDFGPDRLLHNRSRPGALKFTSVEGRRGFTTPRSKVLGRDSFKGMGVDFADINGDGLLDFCVSNIAAEYALEESHFMYVSTGQPQLLQAGVAPYVDRSEELGTSRSDWGWDCRFADFDNDGAAEMLQATGFLKGETDRWPELQELAMGNDELLPNGRVWFRARQGDDLSGHAPNAFFVAAADGRYYDLAARLGLADEAVTRGIATADVDGDGDMDFATANQWDDSRFYRNDCQSCGSFLSLQLRLPVAGAANEPFAVYSGPPHKRGRPALGASVIVTSPDGRRRVAQVDGGNGHSGKRSPELHFGLGALPADSRLGIEVRWRDVGGKLRQHTLTLAPGSHTLLLGTQEGEAS